MAKPETTAGTADATRPPAPRRGNEWMPTNRKAVKGLRDKEVVEVTNDPSDPVDLYRGEHGLMPWSEWSYWRRFNADAPAPAEAVDHPAHYNAHPSGIECIDVVRHMNFNLGNVVKYVWRAGEKDPTKHLQDLKKARWYLDDEIERLSK